MSGFVWREHIGVFAWFTYLPKVENTVLLYIIGASICLAPIYSLRNL